MFTKQTGNRGSIPITKKDGAHPTSYPVGIGGILTGGTNGLEANAVTMLRITGAIPPLPICAHGVFCLSAQFP